MLEHLDYDKSKTKEITLALIDTFKEIDVNGDGILENIKLLPSSIIRLFFFTSNSLVISQNQRQNRLLSYFN
jgi:hypothetical protein